MQWLRAPVVHFVAGGAVLFALVHGGVPSRTAQADARIAPVVVTADDVARLRADYVRETGLQPTDADEAALVQKALDEELLFREAVARGLDRRDPSVRNWLVEQMRALGAPRDGDPDALVARARALGLDRSDLVVRRILVQQMRLLAARADEPTPSDDELAAFYAAHRDDYRAADRVGFWHVFLATDRHAARTTADAVALRAELERDGVAPAAAARRGDVFAVAPHVALQPLPQVARRFGNDVAAAVASGATGRWLGPVASPYGAHLLWIERREPGAAPPLDAVRGRVLERWRESAYAERERHLLRELAQRYPLEVESSAWQARRTS